MKHYKVLFNSKSGKIYSNLDNSVKIKISKFISKLEKSENPKAYGKPLIGNFSGFYRFRVNNFRIITQIIDDKLIILVINLGKRSIIYK